MSWLPSGLSNLTDQLSNFTKDVLTEGTEEIDDHATELRIIKAKYTDVQNVCATQKAELDRLKHINEELSVQVATQELQIRSNSDQYRHSMESKERELKSLRESYAELFSASSHASTNQSSVLSLESQRVTGDGYRHTGEDEDFNDVISSQHEINRLSSEVRRLEAELRRSAANSQSGSGMREDPGNYGDSNAIQLKSEVEELRRQLSETTDRHQSELTALEQVHRQTISSLKRAHREALENMQKLSSQQPPSDRGESQQLEQQLQQELTVLRQKFKSLEERNQKLEYDLEHLHAADRRKALVVDELTAELSTSKQNIASDTEKLCVEKQRLSRDLADYQLRYQELGEELKQTRSAVMAKDELIEKLKSHDSNSLTQLTNQKQGGFDGNFAEYSYEELTRLTEEKQEQITELQNKIEAYEQELEQFDLIKADWQTEKDSLEQTLLRLRDQLKVKEEAQNIMLALKANGSKKGFKQHKVHSASADSDSKGLMEAKRGGSEMSQSEALSHSRTDAYNEEEDDDDDEDDDNEDVEGTVRRLSEQVDELMRESGRMEGERNQLLEERERLDQELKAERSRVLDLDAKLSRTVNESEELAELSATNQNLAERLNEREAEVGLLAAELTKVKDELTEVTLMTRTSSAADRPTDVTPEKDSSDAGSIDRLQERVKELEKELEGVREEKESVEREMERMEEERKSLETSLEELDEQHEQALAHVIKSRSEMSKTCEELKVKVGQLEAELTKSQERLSGLEGDASTQADLKEKFENLERDIIVLRQERNDALEHLDDMLREKETNDGKFSERTAQVEALNEKLAREQAEFKTQLSKLEVENGASKSEVVRLESEAKQLRKKIESLEKVAPSDSRPLSSILDSSAISDERNSAGETSDIVEIMRTSREIDEGQEAKSMRHISESPAALQGEIDRLVRENEALRERLTAVEAEAELYEAEADRLGNFEQKFNELVKSNERLMQVEQKYNELVKQSENQLQNHQEEEDLVKLKQNLSQVQQKCSDLLKSNDSLAHIQQKYDQLVKSNERLSKDLKEKELEIERLKKELRSECVNGMSGEVSGSVDRVAALKESGGEVVEGRQVEEISRLKATISQQEELISTLNSKYSSMLKLLEGRSVETHGNTVLADLHRLETEALTLRREKENMISVMNEKSREASALKSEVHQLMSTVSASKAALSKLQTDSSHQQRGGANEDMKQEAIKQLSQLVRDKDLEIESLQQKSSSLLQVLHDSSPDTSALVLERDEALRQISVYQRDREQLISTLNSKHAESVAFYNETVRLTAAVSELSLNSEQLERNYRNLTQQYEEKQKALVKALNELAACRRSGSASVTMATSSPGSPPTSTASTNGMQPGGDSNNALANQIEDTGSHDFSSEELKRLAAEKDAVIEFRNQTINERDRQLADKEQELARFTASVRHVEETLASREAELAGARKQIEALTFQLTGLKSECDELRRERDELIGRCASMEAESRELVTTNSQLRAEAGGRDYELSMLRDRVTSMGDMLQNRSTNQGEDTGGSGASSGGGGGGGGLMDGMGQRELERLMKELEESHRRAQELTRERDHISAAMQHLQADSTRLSDELMRVREKDERQTRECKRLREHLMQVEEGYTREALEAEEREKQLRNRLTAAEEKLSNSTSAVSSVRGEMSKQIESLQVQLHVMAEQRDNTLLQLSSSQESLSNYAASLANLQMVLEQFQSEKNQLQSAELEQCRRELDKEHAECQLLRQDLTHLQTQLGEATEALDAAHRLSAQLDKKEEMVAAMKDEVLLREAELARCEEKIKELTTSTDAKVDKIIIKNLLLGYFHTPAAKRPEAFQVITQVLSFNHEEMKQITDSSSGNSSSQGWLSSIFRRRQNSVSTSGSGRSTPSHMDQSFSELFVNFLERESSRPPPQARLPAERMVQEKQQQQQQQQQQQVKKPPFNPFAVPMHSTPMPFTSMGSSGSLPISTGNSNLSTNNSTRTAGSGAFGESGGGGNHGNALFGGGATGSHGNMLFGGSDSYGRGRHGNSLIDQYDPSRSHPLMQPPQLPSQMLPVFSARSETSSTAFDNMSNKGSASSSGRSTPATSASILRDVLEVSPSPSKPPNS